MIRCAALAISLVISTMPILPQQASAQAAPARGAPTCMVRQVVAGPASGATFMIVVPASEVAALELRGFVVADCGGRSSQFGHYRKQICEYAEQASAAQQERFLATKGVSPAELCALATRARGHAE